MEIVIVPAWRRPDFLHAALIRLALSDAGPEVQYRICIDRRAHWREMESVVARFADYVGWRRVKVRHRAHRHKGNSYNVLTAYHEALDEDPTLVHLVEEDVLVGADYFGYHRASHQLAPDAFCVSACRCQQFPLGVDPAPDPTAVYRHSSYQSLAVSFTPQQLSRVVQHAGPSYFTNPVRYCGEVFPGSAVRPGNAEQDGLIHRVVEAGRLDTVYPATPRAYHAGWLGYHRKGKPLTGSLDDRATQILNMTAEEMNARAASYPDHQVVPLDEPRPPVTRVINWPGGPR